VEERVIVQDKIVVIYKFLMVPGQGAIPPHDPEEGRGGHRVDVIAKPEKGGFFPERQDFIGTIPCGISPNLGGTELSLASFPLLPETDALVQFYKGFRRSILHLAFERIPFMGNYIAWPIPFLLGRHRGDQKKQYTGQQPNPDSSHGFPFTHSTSRMLPKPSGFDQPT
jgi:hypothetical protein